MAQFAEVDINGKVLRVIEADNNDIINNGGHQSEQAAEYFKKIIPLSSSDNKWIESSPNGEFRGRPAVLNGTYDSSLNIFISFKPFNSWILDPNKNWIAPIPYPSIEEGMPNIFWDEINVRWLGLDPEFVKYEWNKDTLTWIVL
jgi:hypothetical protein